MKDHPEIFLEEATLDVGDVTPSYPLLHPMRGTWGGYEKRPHGRPERNASVRVVGHVSDGPAPVDRFNEFVAACNALAPARHLVVLTKKTYQAKDRRFDLEVLPGVTLHGKQEKGHEGENTPSWMLRAPALDVPAAGGEATGIRGTTAEGVTLTLAKELIDPAEWEALVKSLPSKPAGGS
jgi:hypothetical protein